MRHRQRYIFKRIEDIAVLMTAYNGGGTQWFVLISLRRDSAVRFTDSEPEWLPQAEEKFLQVAEPRAEPVFHTKCKMQDRGFCGLNF